MDTLYYIFLYVFGLFGVFIQIVMWLNMKDKHGVKALPEYFKAFSLDVLLIGALYTAIYLLWYLQAFPWLAQVLVSFGSAAWKEKVLKIAEFLTGKPNAAIFFVGAFSRTLYDWIVMMLKKFKFPGVDGIADLATKKDAFLHNKKDEAPNV